MLRIDIKPLKPGLHTFDWSCEPEELDLDPAVFSTAQIDVRLDVHPARILVSLNAQATASLVCDRTLAPFEQDVEGTYDVLYVQPEFLEDDAEDSEEIKVLQPDLDEIDLTVEAHDTLILALPQRRIAPGAEDLDIQTNFGAAAGPDADIDPRWEALRKLGSQGDAEEERDAPA